MNMVTFIIGVGHIVYIMSIIYACQKYLPLVMVSIFLNIAPVVTVLVGGIFVKSEKMTLGIVA
jgi:drug/metabolite transporter (DMT)-like permease